MLGAGLILAWEELTALQRTQIHNIHLKKLEQLEDSTDPKDVGGEIPGKADGYCIIL